MQPIALDELASVARRITEFRGHMRETAMALKRPEVDVAESVTRLLRQHAEEWRELLDAIPTSSWLHEVVSSHQGSR